MNYACQTTYIYAAATSNKEKMLACDDHVKAKEDHADANCVVKILCALTHLLNKHTAFHTSIACEQRELAMT